MSATQIQHEHRGPLARMARWSASHRKTVVVAWLVALVAVIGTSGAVGTKYANDFSSGNTESQRATDLLKRDFPSQAGDTDQIVFKTSEGKVTDPDVRSRIQPMLAKVATLPHVTGVVSPYSAAGARQVSADGQIAFAQMNFDQRGFDVSKADAQRVIDTAQSADSSSLRIELGGQAIQQAEQQSLGTATAVGLLAAVVILLITFGSLVAMGLPIATALLGLGTGVGLIGLVSHFVNLPDVSTELAVMIGLGVGIDYALFIVTRFRENYRNGVGLEDSIAAAMDTAGRAVVFAGTTVVIALLGMFALGLSFLNGMAIASSLGVLMTMIAALTLLPALLGWLGHRVGRLGRRERRRQPRPDGRSGFWPRWAEIVQRHPWPAAVAGIAIMAVLITPVLSLRTGSSDAGNNAASTTTRQAYDLLAEGFGAGFNGPLQIVTELPQGGDSAALDQVVGAVRGTDGVDSVSQPQLNGKNGQTAVFSAYSDAAPQDQATSDLVNRLRDDVLPGVERNTSTTVLVGGPTANDVDFVSTLSSKLPIFIAVVVLLAALLLMVVFRSVVIPIQAAVMNLLSFAASLGVVVAIFQWGWFGSLLGITGGPIDAFIPVFLFAIIFGLSMDYEVFLVSRIREEWARSGDSSGAVVGGVATTGRVITAAAAIMVCVFVSFALGDDRVLKLFGISLATGVFLDAFVVRSLLLPAVLQILDRRTWALPGWLDRRLPHLAIDGDIVEAGSGVRPQPAFDEAG
jgi:putative drug exporter of the RND superfamily